MKLDKILNKKVKITQIKGGSKLNDRQKSTLRGLGLSGIGSVVELNVDNSIAGMIKKIFHIIKIS